MIKDHKKEQRIKFQPEEKEENTIFFTQIKNPCLLSLFYRKETDMWTKDRVWRHTGDCLRDFWIKTVWDDVPVVFSEEGMGRIEYSTLSIG